MSRRGVTIELDRVGFSYDPSAERSSGTAGEAGAGLGDLTFTAPAGEVTAVLGPSGAGKSTLLAIVAGLLAPDRGDVLFDRRSVVHLPPEKRRLGVVFQSYALFEHMTVEDNVAFGLTVRGVGRRAARRGVAALLKRFEIEPLARRHPRQLSGGERQRVAVARALASEPRALLLDEPLAALDARLRLALRSELGARLNESGVTTLYVTHDQEEAMALGDRVAVLRNGRLEQVGAPEELYRRPATPFVASFIGEANFLPVTWDSELGVLSSPMGTWAVESGDPERRPDTERLETGSPGGGPGSARRARLMVRPEDLSPAEPAGRDSAPRSDVPRVVGRVISSTFLGGRRRVRLAAGDEEARTVELAVDLPGGHPARPGDRLELAIDLGRTVLLPDEDEPDGRPGPQADRTLPNSERAEQVLYDGHTPSRR